MGAATEEAMFRELMTTSPESEPWVTVRNDIVNQHRWIANFSAWRWGDRTDLAEIRQLCGNALITAVNLHIPPGSFAPNAWATCRLTIRGYFSDKIQLAAEHSTEHIEIHGEEAQGSANVTFNLVVQRALADLPNPELAQRLVNLHFANGVSLERTAVRLNINLDDATHLATLAEERLRVAFTDIDDL